MASPYMYCPECDNYVGGNDACICGWKYEPDNYENPEYEPSKERVFVVLEEDRGCGVSVAGVFSTLEAAMSYLEGPNGSNCYLVSKEGEEVQS